MAIPTLTISTPPDPLTGTVTITATTTGVDTVWFWIDGKNVLIDHTAPFTYSWNTASVPDGSHYIVCKGFYAHNKVVTTKKTVTTSNFTVPPPPVCQDPPVNLVLPDVTGTATEGQTLRCSQGSWTNCDSVSGCSCTYRYQWLRCDASGANPVAIPDTTNSYVLQTIDVGSTIRCQVTATNSIGPSQAAQAIQTAVVQAFVPAVPVNTSLPVVSGTPVQGNALSCSTGAWTNAPTSYTYQWRRCDSAGANCTNILNATTSTYIVVSADVGHTLRCNVVASNASGSGTAAASAQTAVATATPPPPPGNIINVAAGQSIASALNQATAGTTVKVAAGTFVEPLLTVKNGVSLVGAGIDQTIIRCGAIDKLLLVQNTTQAQTISDITFDGQNRTTANYGIWAANVAGLTITRIKGLGFKGPNDHTGGALTLTGGSNVEISYSTFLNSGGCFASYGTSVIATGGGAGTLDNLRMHHLTIDSDAGACVGSTNGLITNSDVHDNTFTIHSFTCSLWNTLCFEWFDTDVLNTQIRNCTFNGTVSLTDSTNAVAPSGYRYWIHNNRWNITQGNEYAIELDQNSCTIDHNFVSGGLYPIFNVAGAKSGHNIHHNVFDNHFDCGAINYDVNNFAGSFTKNTIVLRGTNWADKIFRFGGSTTSLTIADNIIHAVSSVGDVLGSPAASSFNHNVFYNITGRGTNQITSSSQMPLTGGFPAAYIPPGGSPALTLGAFADGSFTVGPQ